MDKLTYYNGGENQHTLSRIYKYAPAESKTFPSGIFLFEHPSGRLVLYDTGHPESFEGCGLRGRIYENVLPSNMTEEQNIKAQLEKDGIAISDITNVVLSHLHPDHIGGLNHFQHANIIISDGIAQTMKHPKIHEGYFKALIPSWFDETKVTVLTSDQLKSTDNSDSAGYDLFNDESYVLTELPGHARGQLGAFVLGQTLLAADASWGIDYMDASRNLKPLPKIITNDYQEYIATTDRLARLHASGTNILFSHDSHARTVIE